MLGKKKKQKLPTPDEEETEEDTEEEPEEELEEEPEEDDEEIPKKKKKMPQPQDIGEFTLDETEAGLVAAALGNTEEYKIYRAAMVGRRFEKIIQAYNQVMRRKQR
jgi:hypothetical protein